MIPDIITFDGVNYLGTWNKEAATIQEYTSCDLDDIEGSMRGRLKAEIMEPLPSLSLTGDFHIGVRKLSKSDILTWEKNVADMELAKVEALPYLIIAEFDGTRR